MTFLIEIPCQSQIAGLKRLTCVRCLRAQTGCICEWIRPTTTATEVLILQHPMEVKHAKGSARLLSMSLANSRIEVGECFVSEKLQALLTAPWPTNDTRRQRTPVLLYPPLPEEVAISPVFESALAPKPYADPEQLRLVVIDASWRKSRKMLYLNPLLQNLPRLHLDAIPASKYLIRKAHRPDQLSTFEATCAALMQLEGSNANFAALLAGFEGFVQQQSQALPSLTK